MSVPNKILGISGLKIQNIIKNQTHRTIVP